MSGIYGELLNCPQENGDDVRLRVFGSYHYSRYETQEGYTVIYDEGIGLYCYARIDEGKLFTSGITLDKSAPDVAKHLNEANATIRDTVRGMQAGHSEDDLNFHEINKTFGPNQGLLNGRKLSMGAVRGLTILVNFQDVSSATNAEDVEKMLNSSDYTEHGNISSVRDYFLKVSNNNLDYTNTVVGPYTLSHDRFHYTSNLLVEEALQLAVDDGLNLSQFDSLNEGIIDALNILYAGQSVYRGDLWPHNFHIRLEHGGIRTNLYLLTGLGRHPSELSIGTFCHENGHLLCRFPDMYDYGSRDSDSKDSAGIGKYCLMGSGNHSGHGKSPSPVCAYLRDLAGWCDTVIDLNSENHVELQHGDYGTVAKFRTSNANEYFIVENRSAIGLDRALPASGLAVYHCDTLGSNELQQGTEDEHYQCALLQADGRLDLENNANTGNSTDLFSSSFGQALTSMTTPNTRTWDQSDSSMMVSDISPPGQIMSFRLGEMAVSQTVLGQSSPDMDIPDAPAGGINDSIFIDTSGVISRVIVKVKINHSYIGDLNVKLLSPSGQIEILHAQQGAGTDNLSLHFDSDNLGELIGLIGQSIQGNWLLLVSDNLRVDTGKLIEWSLEFTT